MVTSHNLFGDRKGTIRFKELSRELGGIAANQIAEAQPLADQVRHFRDELFAHRTDKLSYAEVFKRSDISGNDMIRLADAAVAATIRWCRPRSAGAGSFIAISLMRSGVKPNDGFCRQPHLRRAELR